MLNRNEKGYIQKKISLHLTTDNSHSLNNSVVASFHLSLHTCNLPLLARGLSSVSRANVISQHASWPIRTPRSTSGNPDAWVVITPKRPKANSIYTAACHAWTRTPSLNIVKKAVFSLIHFAVSFTCLWPLCHFDFGGSRHGWGLFLERTEFFNIVQPQTKS